MMMLDTIKTKKDFLDHLAHLNDSVDTEDDRGRPRELKSYMLEVDEPILDNLELKNYSIGIKQTNLDHVKFLRVKNHKKNLDFYLDTENPRFNILHTGELAEDADSFVRGLTSSNNHKFDSAWIPTTMLDDIAHSFNNTLWGYGIKYDDIFSEAKGVIPNESLYMTITGNSSKTVRDVIQRSTEHKHTMGYHKISIVHGKNDCGVREDIQYDGRFIIKKGNSIDEHISLLNYVCADILVDNVDNIAEYERQVAKHFAIYGTVYDFVRKKIDGKFNPVTQIANMLAIFRYMKRNEDRFGMDIKLRHLAKVAQA